MEQNSQITETTQNRHLRNRQQRQAHVPAVQASLWQAADCTTAATDNASAEFQRAHSLESRQNEARQNDSEMLVREPAA